MFIEGEIVCNSASNLSVYERLDHLETKKARAIISERFIFFWDGFCFC